MGTFYWITQPHAWLMATISPCWILFVPFVVVLMPPFWTTDFSVLWKSFPFVFWKQTRKHTSKHIVIKYQKVFLGSFSPVSGLHAIYQFYFCCDLYRVSTPRESSSSQSFKTIICRLLPGKCKDVFIMIHDCKSITDLQACAHTLTLIFFLLFSSYWALEGSASQCFDSFTDMFHMNIKDSRYRNQF